MVVEEVSVGNSGDPVLGERWMVVGVLVMVHVVLCMG